MFCCSSYNFFFSNISVTLHCNLQYYNGIAIYLEDSMMDSRLLQAGKISHIHTDEIDHVECNI